MEMIKVEDVSMRFVMANDKVSSIKEFVTAFLSRKLKFKDFWALENVSFEVNKGEVVGIIGRNGAGKSTLLKIISGILRPSKGNVVRNGNIVPMLELGSGFDPDLTGEENIFLNGAILGYSKEFLESKYDEIVEFSELGDFIRMPIRNYSSGMMMRLAFSVATVVQPEILIVDEILAVGDENFQKKSKKRMMELMGGGTTVLYVSHDMQSIREMCNRVVWLEGGTVKMFGDTKEVCDAYDISAPDTRRNLSAQQEKQSEEATQTEETEEVKPSPRDFVMPSVMQFDHYQRYETARQLVEWMKKYEKTGSPYQILEIGSGEQKNLEKMLPDDKICYSDIDLSEIPDKKYDFLVALDVFENIPSEKRRAFLSETVRVSRAAVIGFPFQAEENARMEKELSEYFEGIFGVEYIWFKKHLENGLPSKEMAESFLEEIGCHYVCFEHADLALLQRMLEAQFHFEYYRTGLLEEIEDISSYYEDDVYPHDVGENNYRCFFVLTQDDGLAEAIQSSAENYYVKAEDTDDKYGVLENKIKRLKEKSCELDAM